MGNDDIIMTMIMMMKVIISELLPWRFVTSPKVLITFSSSKSGHSSKLMTHLQYISISRACGALLYAPIRRRTYPLVFEICLEVETSLHAFLISVIDGGACTASRPTARCPEQRPRFPLSKSQCRAGCWGDDRNIWPAPKSERSP
jgi:hypothetical protein